MDMRKVIATGAALAAFFVCGCASSNSEARKQATAHWQKVRTDVTRQMAEQQLRKGQLEQAQGTLRDALRANPDDAYLHLLLAQVLFERRDLSGAQAEVSSARRLAPELAEADYWEGVLAQAAGQWDEAHAAYRVACGKARDSAEYLCALLEAKLALGRCQEAAELAVSRFRDFPRDARLRLLAGSALAVQGEFAQAEALCQEAANLDPSSDEVKQALAQVLCQAGKTKQAAALLASLAGEPGAGRPDLRLLLAGCHVRNGDYAAAIQVYEGCLKDTTDRTAVALRLGEVRLLAGQVERVRQDMEALVAERPGDAEAWELLGHACVLAERQEQAVEAYARAVDCGGEAERLREYIRSLRLLQGNAAGVEGSTEALAASTLGKSQVAQGTRDGLDR